MSVAYLKALEDDNVTFPFNLDAECTEIHDLNKSQQCLFVTTVEDCVEIIEYLDYNYYVFCKFGHEQAVIAVFLCVLWLSMLFIALGVTSNCFLCPALFTISKHLHMSQNVAGVTLLAFGNGSPDIFSSIAGLHKASAELAIASLIGAGVFVTSVVAGSVFLTQSFNLMIRPFLRDVFFYVSAASWALALFFTGRNYVYHGIGFVALYFVYIIVVVSSRFIYLNWKKNKENETGKSAEAPECNLQLKNQRRLSQDASIEVVLKAFYFTDFDWYEEPPKTIQNSKIYFVENDAATESTTNIGSTFSIQSKNSDAKSTEKLYRKSKIAEDRGECWEFMSKVCPISIQKWPHYRWWEKVAALVKSPAILIMRVTVPVMDPSSENQNWCRLLCCTQCIAGPFFIALVSEYAFYNIGGVLPTAVIILLLGVLSAILVFCTSERKTPPSYHWIFAYLGFCVSVTWIYCLANEIVALLQVFGVIFNLSDAILGLTVLAWGNSLSDFLSNVAVAKKNYPRMAISACFGGPLLGLLLGLGIPCIIEIMKGRAPAKHSLFVSGQFIILFSTLGISLLSTVTTMMVLKFETKRIYGAFLITLYVIFVTLSVLEEFGIIAINL